MYLSRRTFCASLALAALGGCARLSKEQVTEPSKLPPPVLPADSVVLEVAFARIPSSETGTLSEIWATLDEQHFPPELRKQLAANGLRVGIGGSQMHPHLRAALNFAPNNLEERSEDVSAGDTEDVERDRRITCRSGRRAKVVATKLLPDVSLLTHEQGSVRGKILSNAQGLFGLKAFPGGDGRVRMELTPEFEYGEMKQRFVGQSGGIVQQIGKDRMVLDSLRMTGTLAPGQVMLVSSTQPAVGLGETFFTEVAAGLSDTRILLVRLVQTQHDDLFAPERLTERLTPTLD